MIRGGPQRIPRPATFRPGPEPWWADGSHLPPAAIGLTEVRGAFEWQDPLSIAEPVELAGGSRVLAAGRRPAAVLCLLWERDGQAVVLLTRRSAQLRSHTGEVAFPGGRLDEGERPLDAARREAYEEVGLDPDAVEIIGQLRPLSTVGGRASVVPFVGVTAAPPSLRVNPAEVDRAFDVALVELMAPGSYHEERWDLGSATDHPVHFFDLPGETVWGATASMLRDLLDLVCPRSLP